MADEQVRLVLDVDSSKVDAARQTVKIATSDVYEFADSYDVLGVAEVKAVDATVRYSAAVRSATATAMLAEAADEKRLATMRALITSHEHGVEEVTKATGANTRLNTTIQQLGYGIGDLMQTSGGLGQKLMAVTNNVQYALSGFGAWGIAAGVALTVVASVVRNFEDSFKHFGEKVDESKDHVQRLEERIKELEEKKVKISVDVDELDKAREHLAEINKGLSAFDEWGRQHTDYEKESGSAIGKMMANTPGGAKGVRDDVRKSILGELETSSGSLREARQRVQNLQKELERAVSIGDKGYAETVKEWLENAREKSRMAFVNVAKEAKEQTGTLYDGATEGDQIARAAFAKRLRKAGRHDVAEQVEMLSAKNLEEEDTVDTQLAAGIERMKEHRLRKKHEDALKAADIDKGYEDPQVIAYNKMLQEGRKPVLTREQQIQHDEGMRNANEHVAHGAAQQSLVQAHSDPVLSRLMELEKRERALEKQGMSIAAATQQAIAEGAKTVHGPAEAAAFQKAAQGLVQQNKARERSQLQRDAAAVHAAALAHPSDAVAQSLDATYQTAVQLAMQQAKLDARLRANTRKNKSLQVRMHANIPTGGAEGN